MSNTIDTQMMFDAVSEAYTLAGKTMDKWTQDKFTNLRETYDRYGRLTDKQQELLQSLTKYIAKSPSNPAKRNAEQDEQLKETALIMKQLREERYAGADMDALNFCNEFEHKVGTTAFAPNKEDLFDYYFQKRKLNVGFSVPNKFIGEFAEYCVGR
jgi:hypothetical protein